MLEKIHAGQMRRLPARRADAEIDRRLAEIDRHQLAVDVGDVQQRDVAERVELEQFGFAQPLLRQSSGKIGEREAAAKAQRRAGGADLEDFTAGDHRMSILFRHSGTRARACGLGIQNHMKALPSTWIPGSRLSARPGMTDCQGLIPGTLSFSPSLSDAR